MVLIYMRILDMGQWDETCALTRTGIRESDPVVMVCLTLEDNYDHRNDGSEHDLLFRIETIERGTYDSYGDIERKQPHTRHWCPRLFFHESAWDAAVKLVTKTNGFQQEGYHQEEPHFVLETFFRFNRLNAHRMPPGMRALVYATSRIYELDEVLTKNYPFFNTPEFIEFWKVLDFAYLARTSVYPCVRGPQFTNEFFNYRILLHETTNEILKKQKEEFDEEEDEID